jgi:hypothetical protein
VSDITSPEYFFVHSKHACVARLTSLKPSLADAEKDQTSVKGVKPYICPFLHLPPCFFCGRIDGCHVKYAWSIPERSITS